MFSIKRTVSILIILGTVAIIAGVCIGFSHRELKEVIIYEKYKGEMKDNIDTITIYPFAPAGIIIACIGGFLEFTALLKYFKDYTNTWISEPQIAKATEQK